MGLKKINFLSFSFYSLILILVRKKTLQKHPYSIQQNCDRQKRTSQFVMYFLLLFFNKSCILFIHDSVKLSSINPVIIKIFSESRRIFTKILLYFMKFLLSPLSYSSVQRKKRNISAIPPYNPTLMCGSTFTSSGNLCKWPVLKSFFFISVFLRFVSIKE